jgi:hypothetical protein
MTAGDRLTLDLSGLATEKGFGRTVDGSYLLRPGRVVLKGKSLCVEGTGSLYKPETRIFDQFSRLWEGSDKDIVRFARESGALHPFDRHGRLLDHNERLSHWRTLSKECWTFTMLLARLRCDGPYAHEDVDGVLCRAEIDASSRWGKKLPGRLRQLFAWRYLDVRALLVADPDDKRAPGNLAVFLMMERWIAQHGAALIGVRPRREKDAGIIYEPVIDYGHRLLRYIGHQLLLLAAGADIFVCSACHEFYRRDRKTFGKRPKPGERNYCGSEECIREKNRAAAARSRKRD